MDAKIFSLESQKNKIYDKRTRKYFEEVYKSYANDCYRSATVMLWSVVVCDIIFKLQELQDVHNDKVAEKILLEIKVLQEDDPYSPKWEKELIKKVFERTQLLDTASNHKILLIQEHRHLSAHPVISDEDTLFEPTQEMIKSDIRNGIEVILSKPPFMSQKILSTFVSDLERVKDLFPSDMALKKYLDAKYFKSMNKNVFVKIFKGLWKFSFRSEDAKPVENREINTRALQLIFEKERKIILDSIKSEPIYYSSLSTNDDAVKSLIEFISMEKEIYDALDDSAKEIIKPVLKNNLSYFGIAFFISDSPEEHVKLVTKVIIEKYHKEYGDKGNFLNPKHFEIFKRVCNELGLASEFLDYGIACFISSSDFERADIYFDRDINNNLEKYSVAQMKVLLDGTNKNNQCYWRNRSRNGSDSIKILQTAKKIMPDGYDFSIYSNLPFEKIDDKLEEDSGEK
ncbi:hypothetical protein AB7W14_18250 [Providencia rettgeri]|uniref:hypothetical protein n=1 Tax=Providencia rettgeri TaxID=587 RepID=UPI00155DF118|nr:hypothetical protein [Providencia rettgeri]EHZ6873192.1 hypothetical protein [Providencia rettgeri]QKG43948.1 hypothetical protein HRD55_04820 [Providencia rettgeri]QNN34077.1 hypothetical protein H9X60_04820 [Providencia rettgeri]